MKLVRTPSLEIGYLEDGPADGPAVVLLHGFPDDAYAWEQVTPPLVAAGCRVLAPWLRGYGPTRFLDPATPRSGEQAALGADLLAFLDALGIERAALAGYDWGGRAACVVAALWPGRVRCLVSINGYNIQDIARANQPGSVVQELRYWYQWYFHTERGRGGLAANRAEFCRLLWRMWSPNWRFDEATFARTAASWDNPDFVDVVIHSYRHRYAQVAGDPALAEIETRLAAQPAITVPTVVLHGEADAVWPPADSEQDAAHFSAFYARRLVPRAGHFLPQEAPDEVVAALRELFEITR